MTTYFASQQTLSSYSCTVISRVVTHRLLHVVCFKIYVEIFDSPKKMLKKYVDKLMLSGCTSPGLQDRAAAGCVSLLTVNHDTAEVHRPRTAGGASSAISHFHNESQWAVNPCWQSYGARRAYGGDTETIKQPPPSGIRCCVCARACVCVYTVYLYMCVRQH